MSKVLITGASGLIGSHLVNDLKNSHEVYTILRRYDNRSGVNEIICDLGDVFDFEILPKKIDTIIYLAQSENFRIFPEKAIEVFQVNTFNLLKMLDYARRAGASKFIYASSGGVYGESQSFRENEPIVVKNDLGFYLSTKLCSEILTDNYRSFMDIVVLRFFFVYGSGQKRSMLIPRLVDLIKEGREIALNGEYGISINPTHVSDAVRAIVSSITLTGSHKINVAGPDILTLRSIAEIIAKKLSKNAIFKKQSGPVIDVVGDINLMTEVLGKPRVKFIDGVIDVL